MYLHVSYIYIMSKGKHTKGHESAISNGPEVERDLFIILFPSTGQCFTYFIIAWFKKKSSKWLIDLDTVEFCIFILNYLNIFYEWIALVKFILHQASVVLSIWKVARCIGSNYVKSFCLTRREQKKAKTYWNHRMGNCRIASQTAHTESFSKIQNVKGGNLRIFEKHVKHIRFIRFKRK